MNFLAWIIVGGVLGWLASIVMKTNAQQGHLPEHHRRNRRCVHCRHRHRPVAWNGHHQRQRLQYGEPSGVVPRAVDAACDRQSVPAQKRSIDAAVGCTCSDERSARRRGAPVASESEICFTALQWKRHVAIGCVVPRRRSSGQALSVRGSASTAATRLRHSARMQVRLPTLHRPAHRRAPRDRYRLAEPIRGVGSTHAETARDRPALTSVRSRADLTSRARLGSIAGLRRVQTGENMNPIFRNVL